MTTKHTKEKKMSTLYKLTDGDGKTRNGTRWGPGVSHSGTGEGGLCGSGWIHAYEHPLIAVLLNPIHADFKSPRLWEADGEIAIRDGQLKCGCATLTTIREIPLPEITTEMWIRFAILCTKEASTAAVGEAWKAWNVWADKWLSGEDRSAAAAAAAAEAATSAVGPARAAYDAAAWAAEAAEAAEAVAAGAARASWAAEAAEAVAAGAAWAAEAAASAAYRSTRAACCGMDLVAIAEKACSGLRNFA